MTVKYTLFVKITNVVPDIDVVLFSVAVFTGFEMRNKYDVLNSVEQQCYYAEEGKNFIQFEFVCLFFFVCLFVCLFGFFFV